MEKSEHYTAIENRINQGVVEIGDLRDLLDMLEKEGLITPAEHETLLHLAELRASERSGSSQA